MKNSIAKDSTYEHVYQQLGNTKESIFGTMKDVMIFCALYAVRKNIHRKTLQKHGGDSIKLDIFIPEESIIDIIALNDQKDISILSNERQDEKITIFEEYANAGIANIMDRFVNIPEQSDICRIIDEMRPEVKYDKAPIDLASLVRESL